MPATHRRTHGIRYFHGCYSVGDDKLWGVTRRRRGGDHSPGGPEIDQGGQTGRRPIYVITDNLSANKTPKIVAWAADNNVESA